MTKYYILSFVIFSTLFTFLFMYVKLLLLFYVMCNVNLLFMYVYEKGWWNVFVFIFRFFLFSVFLHTEIDRDLYGNNRLCFLFRSVFPIIFSVWLLVMTVIFVWVYKGNQVFFLIVCNSVFGNSVVCFVIGE